MAAFNFSGSFSVRKYGGYAGRNPKSGAKTQVRAKRSPFFKAGKELKERVLPPVRNWANLSG
ncbi:MAG: HU family DNA-binding protein [Syntrophales bacterium]|nr:HU family DNA-binding protein [Syntrophales bacterium]